MLLPDKRGWHQISFPVSYYEFVRVYKLRGTFISCLRKLESQIGPRGCVVWGTHEASGIVQTNVAAEHVRFHGAVWHGTVCQSHLSRVGGLPANILPDSL
jgi:hypothetical protein